jgi:hypothetical protein
MKKAPFGILLCVFLLAFGCSSTTAPPAKGTPAFYWQAARETYAAGDYVKTVDHLERLTAVESEFSARGLPWLLVMTSGMSKGYLDLADSFENGARVRKADPAPFRKSMSEYRGRAGRASLQFAEAMARFQNLKGGNVELAFPYPAGSATQPQLLTKITMGGYVQGTEQATAERRALERAVLLQTCRAAGSENDAAKAQELFKAGSVQVERSVFLMALATSLHDQAQIYGRRKLDEPDKLKIFCARALSVLKEIPETKQTKDLVKKINVTLKENKV